MHCGNAVLCVVHTPSCILRLGLEMPRAMEHIWLIKVHVHRCGSVELFGRWGVLQYVTQTMEEYVLEIVTDKVGMEGCMRSIAAFLNSFCWLYRLHTCVSRCGGWMQGQGSFM